MYPSEAHDHIQRTRKRMANEGMRAARSKEDDEPRLFVYQKSMEEFERVASKRMLAACKVLAAYKDFKNWPLYDDVLPFFNALKKAEWPFSETIVHITTRSLWEKECLKQNGVPLGSLAPSSVQVRTIRAIDGMIDPEKFLQDLPGHEEFRVICVTKGLRKAKEYGMSPVCLPRLRDPRRTDLFVRSGKIIPPPDLRATEIALVDVDSSWAASCERRVPFIRSLLALSQWKEEYFDCVKLEDRIPRNKVFRDRVILDN